MKSRSLTLLAALFGMLFLLRPANAEEDSQFDGNAPAYDQPGAVPAGNPVEQANGMAAGHGSYTAQRSGPPSPFASRGSSDAPDLTGLAGGAAGAGVGFAAAWWLFPALGLTLGPVGILGATLLGAAGGAFMMHDKPLAIGVGAAAVGLIAASYIFPPAGVLVTALVLGGAGYIAGKKFFS